MAKNIKMVEFAKFSDGDRFTVQLIAYRAIGMSIYVNAMDCEMDISATYVHCPLRLLDLLAADDFNFAHDMRGILRHLDRSTGELKDFFLPRFAQPEKVEEVTNE